MRLFLISLLLLSPSVVLSKENKPSVRTQIFAEITKLNPKVDKTFARNLAKYIAKYSRIFKTDPKISVAIAMQETAFANRNREGSVLTDDGAIVHGITDVGVFQIHIETIAYLGIDTERLKRDVEYQTFWHTKILAEKIKVCTKQREKLEVEVGQEWSCYHSFTKTKREIYVGYVGPYLAKL